MNYQSTALLSFCLLLLALLSFYLLNFLSFWRTKNKPSTEFTEDNQLYRSINYFAFAMLADQMVRYLVDLFKLLQVEKQGLEFLISGFSFFALFYVTVICYYLILFWISYFFITITGKKSGNSEVAHRFGSSTILFAGVLFSITFLMKNMLAPLFELMIPNPSITGFN